MFFNLMVNRRKPLWLRFSGHSPPPQIGFGPNLAQACCGYCNKWIDSSVEFVDGHITFPLDQARGMERIASIHGSISLQVIEVLRLDYCEITIQEK
jgi:hypothetical protein